MIKDTCECGEEFNNRSAMEHRDDCPLRAYFFAGNKTWDARVMHVQNGTLYAFRGGIWYPDSYLGDQAQRALWVSGMAKFVLPLPHCILGADGYLDRRIQYIMSLPPGEEQATREMVDRLWPVRYWDGPRFVDGVPLKLAKERAEKFVKGFTEGELAWSEVPKNEEKYMEPCYYDGELQAPVAVTTLSPVWTVKMKELITQLFGQIAQSEAFQSFAKQIIMQFLANLGKKTGGVPLLGPDVEAAIEETLRS